MKAEDFNFVKKLKSINLRAIYRNAIKEHEQDIVDLQQEQLSAGLADQGDELQPGYRPRTIENKLAKGQPVDRVTLKDTGEFYRKQYVKYSIDKFEISSRDRKRNKLVNKYTGNRGGDVFGLTPSSKTILAEMIKPDIQEEFRERVFKALS
jgi:hypothetical protein